MSSETMSTQARKLKNTKIKATMLETKKRRESQKATVFQLKIDSSHLNSKQSEALHMIFTEAKWLRNHIVGLEDVNSYTPSNTVDVKLPDGTFDTREFRFIGSQMKQSVVTQIHNDLRGLAASKSRGRVVGKLKFVSEVNSIDLKQHKTTYNIFPDTKRARIQKVPGRVRVHGVTQLEGYELANAKLVRKPSGYYLYVTCFKQIQPEVFVDEGFLGIDFGISKNLTLSNGETFKVYVEETERLKKLQRKLSRQHKGSNSYQKTVHKIRRQYELIDNRKNDLANKIVTYILSEAEFIFIQDEMLYSWKTRFGKTVQHSVLGRVKSKLVTHGRVFVLPKSCATTQTCRCGKRHKMPLGIRTYVCDCGYMCDRDVHSARQMVRMGFDIFNTCGTQGFKASGDSVRLEDFIVRNHLTGYQLSSSEHESEKLEAATSLVSR